MCQVLVTHRGLLGSLELGGSSCLGLGSSNGSLRILLRVRLQVQVAVSTARGKGGGRGEGGGGKRATAQVAAIGMTSPMSEVLLMHK